MSLLDLNQEPEGVDPESGRKRTRWSKEESVAMYEIMENFSAEDEKKPTENKWRSVSARMNNIKRMERSAKECEYRNKNLLQQYRKHYPSASNPITYTQLKEFLQQEFTSIEHPPSETTISVTYEGCTKSINTNACSVVIAVTIRSEFGFEDAQRFVLRNESGVGFGIERNMPPGNYSLHLIKSETTISVTYEGCTKSINTNASSEVIALAIRSEFGLEDAQRFMLRNDSVVGFGIERNMPPGNYSLHLIKSETTISVTYEGCTKSINTNACSVVIAVTIRSEFGFEDAQRFVLRNESGVGFGIERNMPPGNYSLHLIKSETTISVTYEGCTKSINTNASSEVIALAIRSEFGFEDAQRFVLRNESGVGFGIERNMPPGNYNLHLIKSETTISVTYEGCTKSINTNACSVVIAVTIRSEFGFEDAQRFVLRNESGVGFGIERNMPPGNYNLHLIKSETTISVTCEGCTKSFNTNACSEAIAAEIRLVFGLEDAQRFWLENEYGVTCRINTNMPPGNYSLHLAKDLKRKYQMLDLTVRSE